MEQDTYLLLGTILGAMTVFAITLYGVMEYTHFSEGGKQKWNR